MFFLFKAQLLVMLPTIFKKILTDRSSLRYSSVFYGNHGEGRA